MPESSLYQYLYHPAHGYLVFRCGMDDRPIDRKAWAEVHKQAVFVTEMAAIDYCNYRNHGVDVNGDDRLPVHMAAAGQGARD